MKNTVILNTLLLLMNSLACSQDLGTEDMVLIEGGTFMMGMDGQSDQSPTHAVTIHSFYMDIHEVTNSEYAAFCEATGHHLPEYWGIDRYSSGPSFPDHPVVGVSSADAMKYAAWKGKRLPTEAEWEYAARGGLIGQPYPGGASIDSSMARINHPSFSPGPMPVMSFPPNGYGLYDMAGNVWEWVLDWYRDDYYGESPENNPEGPDGGRFRVFRGGGWHSGPGCNKVHYRNALPPHWVDIGGGFRCVKPAF